MENSETTATRWVEDRLAKLSPEAQWHPNVTRALARLEERRVPRRITGGKWTWMAVAALTACICLFVFLEPKAFAERLWVRCVAACEGLLGDNGGTVQVLALAPDFALKDAKGSTIRLSAYKGKVVLLNFWATWCPPCRTEMPWFAEFERAYAARGFAVIGVSMDDIAPDMPHVFVDTSRILYPLLPGDSDLAKIYGVNSLPMTLLIDREGRISVSHVGIVERKEYQKAIESLLEQ